MKHLLYLLLVSQFVLFSCKKNENKASNLVFEKGNKVGNDKFTGTVHQAILGKIGTQTSNVTFEPKSRTNWHSHPGGQTLLVTDGIGYHQIEGKPVEIIRKGDVINVDKNVKHWHGGSIDCGMTHIAISIDHEEHPSEWFQLVSEDEYNSYIKSES
ncbi:cupin domain-containing protein [Chishuiella sp.]|uniref:cupin domain-containing protein n=1 Tax=Chishuiella sp. TaxID=1969467 RepID=UPI0028B1599B|nr:cupin domain-containing protein [Chishuiella sp.]